MFYLQKNRKLCFLLALLGITACLKHVYEGPPDTGNYDPKLTVTHTIAQLVSMPLQQELTADITVCGAVVMNDRSGNYYQKIVIQDSTGGIAVLIDRSSLYSDYPIGRKLYIKCKGLYVGNAGGETQLGAAPDADGAVTPLPSLLSYQYIIKADYSLLILPDTITVAQLLDTTTSRLVNKLVVLKDVEFAAADTAQPYSRPSTAASATWRNIADCSGAGIALRTSAYADFHAALTPSGKGTVTALFTKYRNQPQLCIRDLADVALYGQRCGNTGGQVLFSEDFAALADNSEITLVGWNNIAEEGGRKFTRSSYQSDVYAKISATGAAASAPIKSWLITPRLDLGDGHNVRLLFKTKDGYDNGALLKVCYASDYSGSGNPSAATWTDLPANISNGTVSGYAGQWTEANVALPSRSICIAFRYEGGAGKTTTFNLGYIRILSD